MKSWVFTNGNDISVKVPTDGWGVQSICNVTANPSGKGAKKLMENGMWPRKGMSITLDEMTLLAKLLELSLQEHYSEEDERNVCASGNEYRILVPMGKSILTVSIEPKQLKLKVKGEIHPLFITSNLSFTAEDGTTELIPIPYTTQTVYSGNSINIHEMFFMVKDNNRTIMSLMDQDPTGRSGVFGIDAVLPEPFNKHADIMVVMDAVNPPHLF